jgi:hypothetical protein
VKKYLETYREQQTLQQENNLCPRLAQSAQLPITEQVSTGEASSGQASSGQASNGQASTGRFVTDSTSFTAQQTT